ncbi:MAG: hypothetical protein LBN04_03040 [Oscillospiraceae bacterium]|jgi:pilin isopeptide linkage protein|nr:hypothetical protein [Oscillospiraceae bacterium]
MAAYDVNSMATLNAALNSTEASIDITITGNFDMPTIVSILENKTVTITSSAGGPYTIRRGIGATGNLFTVPATSSLTVSGTILDGDQEAVAGVVGSLIYNSGTLTLNDGAVLQNNLQGGSETRGSAITNIGHLTMNPGSIVRNNSAPVGNIGGTIVNFAGGTFHMDGAEISGNYGGLSGGILSSADTENVIINSRINENSSYNTSAIYMTYGTLTITDSKVNNNRATIRSTIQILSGATIVMTNTQVSGNQSVEDIGGIRNRGTATLTNSEISHNTNGGVQNTGDGILTIQGGSIAHNASGTSGGGVVSGGKATHISDTTIANNTATNGGGIYLSAGSELTISGNTQIIDNIAAKNGGGIDTPYDNLAHLDVGAGVVFSGNRATQAYQIAPEDIPLYEAHILTDRFTGGLAYGYNNLDIGYTNGSPYAVDAVITAHKDVVGAALPDGRFDFGLFSSSGAMLATATNDASGHIAFPAQPFTVEQMGAYTYTVREVSPSGSGWIVDGRTYPATITVSIDQSTGLPVAAIAYPEGNPIFVNTYDPTPASVDITAYKVLSNWPFDEKTFEFGLYDVDGQLIETAQNTDGVIDFPQLPHDARGEFHYTIGEITQSGEGWTTDANAYPVTVTVVDEGGQLVDTVTYPQGQPTFYNHYLAAPTIARIEAVKQVSGCCRLSAEGFSFGLFDGAGEEVARAMSDKNGAILFSLPMDAAGTYPFTLRELNTYTRGWKLDRRAHQITVTVTDNGQGQLLADVAYAGGKPPIFQNVYDPNPTAVNGCWCRVSQRACCCRCQCNRRCSVQSLRACRFFRR